MSVISTKPDLVSGGGTQARFPSQTHWTLIVHASAPSSPKAEAALNELCQTYWFPIYAFVRRKGNDSHKAKDLTQSFFLHMLRKNAIKRADRQKGRFRSFLCASLNNFLIDEIRASKHERCLVPIPEEAEAEYRYLPTHEPDPAKLFDRTWAATAIKQATERLKQAYADKGKIEVYEALKRCVAGELSPDTYPALAAKLGMTYETFEVNLSRFKKSFGRFVRGVIAETVTPSEIEDEIKYLMTAWASHLEDTKRGATRLA
jgi:RNA polymerase sigma-70 factor (ECF subfamily)